METSRQAVVTPEQLKAVKREKQGFAALFAGLCAALLGGVLLVFLDIPETTMMYAAAVYVSFCVLLVTGGSVRLTSAQSTTLLVCPNCEHTARRESFRAMKVE